MKQRFSSLDIKVIAHELSKIITSLRVSNIYDLSSRIFLFKFAASSRKEQFVVDSGFRCHLSQYARTTAGTPSAFVTRLRKFLRSRRVTKVAQVGTDRILEFEFSDGQYHLFFEFYAGGNIVLTDTAYKIVALQRNVNEGAAHEQIRAGLEYNLSERQNVNGIPPMTKKRLEDGLQTYIDKQAVGQQSTNKKLKKKAGDTLRKALGASINEYPPMLLDHSLRKTGFNIDLLPEDVVRSDELLNQLLTATEEAERIMREIMSMDVVKGYIFGKPVTNDSQAANGEQQDPPEELDKVKIMYEDFHPFKPQHIAESNTFRTLEFEGFNRTVDEFFSSIEGQRLESRLAEKETNARRKLENAKQEQEKRLGGLQQVQETNVRRAQAIEANLERVQEAVDAVNSLIAQGMDWDEVEKLVELEQRRYNPVAEIIKLPLKLKENTVTLKLAEWEEQEDEELGEGYESPDADPSTSEDEAESVKDASSNSNAQPPDKRLNVDIDLSLSPWSNARDYYDQKRSAASKEEKTMQASARALKSTQRKVEADLKRALKQEKQTLRPVRQGFWFEKFDFFISSDGYLVLGATDAQQSDLLWRRHLKPGDVWVHADLEGALPCVVKNRSASDDAPIPPGTLAQAGSLSVATSKAWESKAVMSAWWVSPKQIFKKARTGDYLPPGRFEVIGDKNFLPPAQLLLGFAVVFRISEESKARHMKHRVREDLGPSNTGETTEPVKEPTPNGGTDHEDGQEAAAATDERAEHTEKNTAEEADGDDSASNMTEEDEEEHAKQEDPAEETAYNNPLQPNDYEPHDDDNGSVDNEDASEDDDGDEIETSPQSVEQQRKQQAEEETVEAMQQDFFTSEGNVKGPLPVDGKTKAAMPVRGKKGKKKKLAQKYADQDDEDRAEAMRLLGSAAGQQKQKAEETARAEREKEQAAQRQRRREQHQKAQERRAQRETEGVGDEEEEDINDNVDLDTLVGMPLPGDDILEALPICAPWGALGRYKYKAKLQPGSEKKGKAVRSILAKWVSDAAAKKNVDDTAKDTERIWPKEMELIKSWKEAEIFGVVPVSKVRVMMSGASSKDSGKGGAKQKSKKPSGRGSKKQR